MKSQDHNPRVHVILTRACAYLLLLLLFDLQCVLRRSQKWHEQQSPARTMIWSHAFGLGRMKPPRPHHSPSVFTALVLSAKAVWAASGMVSVECTHCHTSWRRMSALAHRLWGRYCDLHKPCWQVSMPPVQISLCATPIARAVAKSCLEHCSNVLKPNLWRMILDSPSPRRLQPSDSTQWARSNCIKMHMISSADPRVSCCHVSSWFCWQYTRLSMSSIAVGGSVQRSNTRTLNSSSLSSPSSSLFSSSSFMKSAESSESSISLDLPVIIRREPATHLRLCSESRMDT